MRRKSPLARVLAFSFLFLSVPLAAQGALVVDDDGGPGVDHTTIAAAVAAAAPGTTILVRDGVYTDPITIDGAALTIVAETGSSVVCRNVIVENLPTGADVKFHGLRFTAIGDGTLFRNNLGSVWARDCTFTGETQFNADALILENSDQVFLERCTLTGFTAFFFDIEIGSGLVVSDSTAFLSDCIATGGGAVSPVAAGPGIEVLDGVVFAADSNFKGGDVCDVDETPAPGALVDGASSSVHLRGCVLEGGGGSGNPFCASVPQAPPSIVLDGVLEEQSSVLRRVSTNDPVRTDEPVQIEVRGLAGEFVLLAFSVNPEGVYLAPFFSILALEAPAVSFATAVVGPSGVANLALTPALPPGDLSGTYYTQSFHLDVTAPPGQELVLGSPTTTTVLDASL